MKKNAIILSGFSLGLALMLSVLIVHAQTYISVCVPANNRPNTGSCYTSNSSDNQKCVSPQNGDAADCGGTTTAIKTINNGN